MNERLNMSDLVAALAARNKVTKRMAETYASALVDVVETYVKQDGVVRIKELGVFKLVTIEKRESVDVNTGQRITIEAHQRLAFSPYPLLRDTVNRPFSDFETVTLSSSVSTQEMEFVPPLPEETQEEAETLGNNNEAAVAPPPSSPETTAEGETSEAMAATETGGDTVGSQGNIPPENGNETMETDMETENNNANGQADNGTGTSAHVERQYVERQYVEHQTIEQMVAREVSRELAKQRSGIRLSWGGVAAWVLLALILMTGAFVLGWYLSGPRVDQRGMGSRPPRSERVVGPRPAPVPASPTANVAPTASTASKGVENAGKKPVATPSAQELAKGYDQVEGGDYWITGTKEEHTIVVGDNLYALARKVYGDKELATYIVKHNHITDPDHILLGMKLKLPELTPKMQGGTGK